MPHISAPATSHRTLPRVFLALLAGLLIAGCSGNSSSDSNSGQASNGNNTPKPAPITQDSPQTGTLQEDVIVKEDLNTVQTITQASGEDTGNIILTTPPPADWAEERVVLFTPTDDLPDGLAIRIERMEETATHTKVTYTLPTIDQLFADLSSGYQGEVAPRMVKAIHTAPGVAMQAQALEKPSNMLTKALTRMGAMKPKEVELEWLPDLGKFSTETYGLDTTTINLSIERIIFNFFDVVIVRNKNDHDQAVTLSGSISLTDITLESLLSMQNNDVRTLQSGAQLNFTIERNLEIRAHLSETTASLSNYVPEKFQCHAANKHEVKKGGLTIDVSGAEWPASDVCLGKITLGLAGISVSGGAGGVTEIQPSLNLYLILGADLQLTVQTAYNYEQKDAYTKGAWLDMTKDADERLRFVHERTPISTQNKFTGSEVDGHIAAQFGTAFAVNVAGIKPVVSRAYIETKLEGRMEAPWGDIPCARGSFTVGLKWSAHLGASANVELDVPRWFPKWVKQVRAGLAVLYNYEGDIGRPIVERRLDSCAPDTLTFEVLAENGTVQVNDIVLTDLDGDTHAIAHIWYSMYGTNGALLDEGENLDGFSPGDYVLAVQVTDSAGNTTTAYQDITIPPSPSPMRPELNAKLSADKKAVILTWSKVANAGYYELWRGDSNDSAEAVLIAAPKLGDANYTDRNAAPGKTHHYWAKACNPAYATACSVFSEVASITLPSPPSTSITRRLNDTGIMWSGNYPSGNNDTCAGSEITGIAAPQDCDHGRDAEAASGTLAKVGAGAAGFDFTKLDMVGNDLPASATAWRCVRDNHTGLVWEKKTTDGGIHDKDNTYQWGGKTALGYEHPEREGPYYDGDTGWNALVDGANGLSDTAPLCGITTWRVPTLGELASISHKGRSNPAIDTDYFPDTASASYWSASPDAKNSRDAIAFAFDASNSSGSPFTTYRYSKNFVRLVGSKK